MNDPFDYIPSDECRLEYRALLNKIETLRQSDMPADIDFIRELDEGKMLGVMIAEDSSGRRHTLYAFSGQLGTCGFIREGFVEPVFDYLQPDGYFKTRESEITLMNRHISRLEADVLPPLQSEYDRIKRQLESELEEYRKHCRQSKLARAARRAASSIDKEETERMILQSQFEKAELRRLKKRINIELESHARQLEETKTRIENLKEERHQASVALQDWLFSNFRFLNADGESMGLKEIFADTTFGVPPSGAGECCAPKLLQATYRRKLRPVSMAEFWHGRPKAGEVRIAGEHYPACRGKCLPILNWMLRGLDIEAGQCRKTAQTYKFKPKILFENRWFCVIDKPSGMLSVRGKSDELSVEEWLRDQYGSSWEVKMAHRLDQDTSGLIVAAFGPEVYRALQSVFAGHKADKRYIAILDGDYMAKGVPQKGRISLPLSADILDRPRQRIDMEGGKQATTDYEFTGVQDNHSRVIFKPLTGRTHQLRVHSAADAGLGMPIVGDRLYGHTRGHDTPRLMLHATRLSFTFPLDGKEYSFTSPSPF